MRSPRLLYSRLRFLPVLVVAVAACGDGGSPLDPTTDPTTGATTETGTDLPAIVTAQRIAWISSRTSWPELYKMDPLGSQVAPITSFKSGSVDGLSWSWDNKRLATIRYRGVDAFHGHNDVWIVNADGTNGHWARPLPSTFDFYDPSFSPDGKRIVMTVHGGGTTKTLGWIELATGNAGLFWIPGSGAVRGWHPSYNKAGTKIIYVGPTGFTVDQINPDGSGHKVRISPNAWVGHPMFSPDGKKISYQKGASPGNIDIYVKNFTTGLTTRLTSNAAVDAFASWSPDGSRIAFMSKRSGKNQVYTMNAATGGDLRQITNTSVDEYAPVWSH
jgi:Tol biopolymer transport system component